MAGIAFITPFVSDVNITQDARTATPEQRKEQDRRQAKSDAEDLKIAIAHNQNMQNNNADGSGDNEGGVPNGKIIGAVSISAGAGLRIGMEMSNPDPSKDASDAHTEKAQERIIRLNRADSIEPNY